MITSPDQNIQASLQQNTQQKQASDSKKAGQRAFAMSGPDPKTVPDGYDVRQAALKMHEGGIVPGKKGEDVPVLAQAGEEVISADKVGRSSEYRKVYMGRKKAKS
jgi:hypothetical protein